MHSLAIALHRQGHIISGSDDQIYDPAKSKLKREGLLPEKEGWSPERIDHSLDAVILGMHAFKDNPELLKAKELNIPIYSFPEFIHKHSINKHRVVVAGSYGKTTITSMIMHVLKTAGKKFDYLVGADVPGFDLSVKLTADSPTIVLEGDEYLSSKLDPRPKFILYRPHSVVITGIAWDHINVFPSEDEYINQFKNLVSSLDKGADIIYNEEDKTLTSIVRDSVDRDSQYLHEFKTPKYKVQSGIFYPKLNGLSHPVKIFGKHNMSNLMAAWKTCELMGVDLEKFFEALHTFEGPNLRLEKVHEDANRIIFKDYAHAPPKVLATVHALRERFPTKNLIACFELHTFSSINRSFLPFYKNTLNQADIAIVFLNPDTFKKRRMAPFTLDELKEAFSISSLISVSQSDDLLLQIESHLTGDDVILMMSSGNFGKLAFSEIAKI